MDFMNRNAQTQAPQASAPAPVDAPQSARPERGSRKNRDTNKLWRTAAVSFLFALTILVIAVVGVILFGGSDQGKFIKNNKYQAVFLTNGQVYFGKISDLNRDFIRLDNIYYLTQNTTTNSSGQTTTDGNYTLVKLGCQQIHYPFDQMIIERDQVSFWENLNDNGKVVQSINQFNKQNPNGPDCSQVSNQTQASSNAGTQGGTNSGANNSGTPANKQ